jgi:hypothetical protein
MEAVGKGVPSGAAWTMPAWPPNGGAGNGTRARAESACRRNRAPPPGTAPIPPAARPWQANARFACRSCGGGRTRACARVRRNRPATSRTLRAAGRAARGPPAQHPVARVRIDRTKVDADGRTQPSPSPKAVPATSPDAVAASASRIIACFPRGPDRPVGLHEAMRGGAVAAEPMYLPRVSARPRASRDRSPGDRSDDRRPCRRRRRGSRSRASASTFARSSRR